MGLNRMAREADWKFLLAALAIMPISYLLTSYRWHLLLEIARGPRPAGPHVRA